MAKRESLIGKKFGSLIVVKENGRNKRQSVVWSCVCECGDRRDTTTNLLKSGKIHSCGCQNKKSGKPRDDKSVVGKKFNSLLIKEYAGTDKWRQITYAYRCDCGNEGVVPRCKIGKWNKCPECRYGGYGKITQGYWGRVKRQAKSRNIKFNLKIQDAWAIFKKQDRKCALTGINLYFPKTRSGRNQTASLDRIDSLKGYVKNNVQWVHKKINELKWNLTTEELLHWCSLVVENNKEI